MMGATNHAEAKWSNFVYARDLAKQYLEDGSKTDEDFESCIFNDKLLYVRTRA